MYPVDTNRLDMQVRIKITGESEVLFQAVNLENMTFGVYGQISTHVLKDGISVQIDGRMSLGTMKYTVDDLLKSLILAESVSGVVCDE